MFQPQLPWALTESALLAGDHEVALFGAEMAKSRILADLRTDGVDVPASPRSLALGLSERLRAHPRVHLLSFLVDHGASSQAVGQAGVLAVLRLADGRTFGARITLNAEALEAAAQMIDHRVRRGHGRKLGDIYAAGVHTRPFDDVLTAMAPLISWLEPLVLDTQLCIGDTLVYAADGALHNVPLGMLPLAGRSLIDHFALVAMPSLALGFTPGAAVRPRQALAVLAPDVDERAAGMTYESEIATLRGLLPTTVAIDFASLLPPAGDRLLHLCAHGEVVDGQPLTHGGLMLPAADGRYDRLDATLWVSADKLAAAVAPGTHVTLRSCLVGRAEQVTSREPLGVVWSVLAGAAASIVAASWTVDIDSAGRWCDHFYESWLARGMSRAQAHRAACLAVRAEGGEWTHPAHWAPFVLYAATFEGDIVMDDELRARVRALTDKQAIHYVNRLASSLETDGPQSDEQFLEAVSSELQRVTASGLRMTWQGVIPNAESGELARRLLLFLIDTGVDGRHLTEAALRLPQTRTADFGTLTHAAVLIIGWLAVTGDIRVKLGGFEYHKPAITPASQAKLAKDFLASVGKLLSP